MCGPRNAKRRTAVLAWAKPERFATLTDAPDDWQSLRQKMRTLALNIRKQGYVCQWAWTVEVGSKTGMRHVHALQHGQFIPQRKLQDLWGHIVHIERITSPRGAALYSMKEARRVAGYATKNTRQHLLTHLDNNGGRVAHMSRGYLHGLRTREVEKLLWPNQHELTWVLELVPGAIGGPGCRQLAKLANLPLPHRVDGIAVV